ncbi:glycosyltransferase [Vibrio metschnikovii]|uniref:glycosyltransferase n=1 Tax=Vibrio metschnikovii TaxID=28172 RepID=UPI0033229D8C
MKKISILLPDFRGGGAEKVFILLANEWSRMGFDVEFLVLRSDGEFAQEVMNKFIVHDLKANKYRHSLIKLINFFRKGETEILIIGLWPLTAIGALAAKLSSKNIRTIVTEHSILTESFAHKGLVHRYLLMLSCIITFRMAHARIGVSKGVSKEISKLSCLKPNKILTINNPIEKYTPNVDNLIEYDIPTIITAGSFKDVKNHALLIEAFKLVSEKKECQLIILGDGKLKSSYIELINKYGLVNKVKLCGFVPEPKKYFINADVFVLSSNNEGFGNVLIEAMQCGLTIVSTDCPSGPREILDNERFGKLVPVKNVELLADAIIDSLNEPTNKDILKNRSEEYVVEKIAMKYLEAFK